MLGQRCGSRKAAAKLFRSLTSHLPIHVAVFDSEPCDSQLAAVYEALDQASRWTCRRLRLRCYASAVAIS